MARLVHSLLVPAFLLCGWLAAAPALMLTAPAQTAYAQTKTPPRRVQDDAAMFSATAKEQANAEITRIKTTFKKDLTIETLPQGPKRPANVAENDDAARKKFFDQWAVERFKNEQINGVYVVIVEKPEIVRVVVGDKTRDLGLFTTSDRDQLRQKIIEKMKTGDKDGALLAATKFVQEAMSRNRGTDGKASSNANTSTSAPAHAPRADSTPWLTYLLIGIAVLVVLWLIIAVFRALSGGGRPGYAGGPGGGGGGYGGGGGGGFFTSMLGGLFGAAAGMWMYNNLFGGHSSSAFGAGPTGDQGNATSEPTDVGGGASVSGGDYDAGGDAGGGDAGGGGGDWGGGGDGGDAGGGGGDWGGGGGGDWGGGGGDFGGGGGDW
ncbi:MAG: TPM domain-containing protein [Planctomycetes bacterium]|nr:TPM domain-containing protein [Planctomycetota bacterium]